MKTDIIKNKKAEEVPATVTDAKAFQEANNLLFLAQQFGLAKLLSECAAIYNYRKSGAFSEDKNGGDFIQSIGMSLRSAQVRLKIANVMRTKVNRTLGLTAAAEFIFTEQTIKQTFDQYFERRRDVGITDLLSASHDVQTFTNFLEGKSDIKESEVVKLLGTGGKEKEEAASSQGDLFTMHDAIKKAGYKLREDGTWLDPRTGEAMTREQLAEFVDEETGFYLFSSAKKMLSEMHAKLTGQQKYSEYVHAYMLKHPSPETEKIVQEQQKELADLAGDILYIATTILSEEEN